MQSLLQNHRRWNHRGGLTLVELLVVIAIISIVSAATIPLFTPPVDDQKTREAARMFSTMLESARSRAVETGRPAGIWLQPLAGNTFAVSDMFLCEVPEPYSGDDIGSTVTLQSSGGGVQLTFTGAGSLNQLCHYGDQIRFNSSGEYYVIQDAATSMSLLGQPISGNPFLGKSTYQPYPGFLPASGASSSVPYQIIRAPVKSAGTPMSLPVSAPAALIDLGSSDIGVATLNTFTSNAGNPILITFEPSGQVSKITYTTSSGAVSVFPAGTLYFLVRLNKDPPDPAVSGLGDGFRDQSAAWVAINSTTGLVSVSDNTYSPSGSFNTMAAARAGAQRATQKGGL